MRMYIKNTLLRIRFIWLVYVRNYFNEHYPPFLVPEGYKSIFRDLFNNGVNWKFWMPNEEWGNKKGDVDPYIIWKKEQVQDTVYGIGITTDLNTTVGEPAIKSGQICSWKNLYQTYGRYRCTMKASPHGIQSWWAFWLIGKECIAEIDICEFMSDDCKRFTVTLHANIDGVKKQVFCRKFYTGIDLSQSFHLYEVDWQKDYMCWYLDGIKLCEYTGKNIPNTPMGIIVNNSVSFEFRPKDHTKEELDNLFPATGFINMVEVLKKI